MLEILGLDKDAETLYRAMLSHPQHGVAALAALVGLTDGQVRSALDRLSELALVHASAGLDSGFRVVAPQAAMEALLARQQAALAEQQLQVEASRAAAAQLIAECSALLPAPADADGDFEYLTGPEEIRARLGRFAAEVEREIMTFAPGGAHTTADLQASREPNQAMLSREVIMRTIYLDSVRNHQPTLDHVQWLGALGGQVRTAPTLPIRMIIADRRQAVLPVDTADARAGAVILRGVGTVTALCALFESTWDAARPLGAQPQRDRNGVPPQEAEVLRLLARGLTDEAIAKRLGVSPRTARRIAADLMDRLEAQSRFQAGVHAVQNGWLPAAR
jgi:DNA-binding CsgD family transcriptional regulator/sugar-specific transcriptional regulator TrmB